MALWSAAACCRFGRAKHAMPSGNPFSQATVVGRSKAASCRTPKMRFPAPVECGGFLPPLWPRQTCHALRQSVFASYGCRPIQSGSKLPHSKGRLR
jgi:hypothetical protein